MMSRHETAATGTGSSPSAHREGRTTYVRYVVLGWLCLSAMLAYAQRFQLGLGVKRMQADLDLSDGQMGWAMGAFFISYAALQIPGGRIAEHWGSRAALALCVTLCSVAAGATGAVVGLTTLVIARAVTGAGQAGIFPATTASFARWFPSGERAIASGLLAGFMSLGAAGASALTGALLQVTTWRWIFLIVAIPGLVWSIGFWLWYRDRPEDHSQVSAKELAAIRGAVVETSNQKDHVEPIPWGALIRSKPMWLIAWQQFFRAAGYALFATWFTRFMGEVHALTEAEAAIWNTAPLLSVVAGSWIGGFASDWLLRVTGSRGIGRKLTAAVTMFGCGAMFLVALYQTSAVAAISWIAAAAFLGAVAGPVAYAITIDMGGNHVPTVFSIMNMSGNIGAASFPILVPYVVKLRGNWSDVLVLVAGIYALGGLCWLALNPSGTVFHSDSAKA